MNIDEYHTYTENQTLTWSCQDCLFPFTDSFLDSLNGSSNDSLRLSTSITSLIQTDPIDLAADETRTQLSKGLSEFSEARGLKIAHLNVGNDGLLHDIDELTSLCHSIRPDVLAVTETWLRAPTDSNCVAIEGYDFYRRDKPNQMIGAQGTGLYVKQGISITQRPDLSHPQLMCQGVQLDIPNRKPVIVIVAYRHPKTPYLSLITLKKFFHPRITKLHIQ